MAQIHVIAGILAVDGNVLLQYRTDTGKHSDHWGLPGGKIELGESTQAAILRELNEELGIAFNTDNKPDYICTTADGLSFAAYLIDKYEGEITNMEPDLCGALSWHRLDCLPTPLTPATKVILEMYLDAS